MKLKSYLYGIAVFISYTWKNIFFIYFCDGNLITRNTMEALILDLKKRYTYADYLAWADDIRRELIAGFINMMARTSLTHGDVCRNLIRHLDGYTVKWRNTLGRGTPPSQHTN